MYASFDYIRRVVPETATAFFMEFLFPLSGAAIDLDFAGNRIYPFGAFTDYLSISRASTGYAKTSTGTLTQFNNNELRITDLGLLIEDSRTNVETFSQAIDDTNWTTDGSASTTYTLNAAVAPDGTTTMSQVFDSTGGGSHRFYHAIASGYTTFTASIYVKDVDRRYFDLEVQNAATSDQVRMMVDLQTGVVTDTVAFGGGTITSATTEQMTNGIWRIILSGTVTVGAHYFLGSLSDVSTFPGGSSPSYVGSNKSVYVWGAQLESGSFASSYVPTTTTSATRATDVVTVIGSANSILSALPQSCLVDLSHLSPANGGQINIVGVAGVGSILFYSQSAPTAVGAFLDGGFTASATFGNSRDYSTGVKVAIAQGVEGQGMSIVGGGGTVVTDPAEQAIPDNELGNASGTRWYGYFRRVTIWDSKLADATLQSLTYP